jgi:transcription antitermination factor NusG
MSVESVIPYINRINGAPTNHSWYAIRVRSKFERGVAASLSGKGYEQYLPMYRSRRQWSDRTKEIDLPLFPGYLFCRFDAQVRLPILTIPGVISVVGISKTPVAVPDHEIDMIQTMVRSGLLLRPWPQLVVGSRILIEKGPLQGVEGVTLDIKKKHHLIVSVPLLQRSVAVEIDRDWVRPLPAARAARDAAASRLLSVAKVA